VVVWTKGANSPAAQYVWAQAISSAGNIIGGNFLVSASTSDQRWFPVIASSDSNYLFAWGQSGATSNIMGNVDYSLVGVGEERKNGAPDNAYSGPTVMKQLPSRFCGDKYKIFDVSGRAVLATLSKPGVYFVALGRGEVVKITIVR
jgi:hypothetical protein